MRGDWVGLGEGTRTRDYVLLYAQECADAFLFDVGIFLFEVV